MKRILLTGAAGRLGSVVRPHLAKIAVNRRLNDIAAITQCGPDEEVAVGDLSIRSHVQEMVEGCDGIIHLGGIAIEDTFEKILGANVVGTYNIYESARLAGVKRIFLASSNHATGFYPVGKVLDADTKSLPDSLYGASKVWSEAIADLYFHKFGIETAKVRIGSCWPEPGTARELKTWFSHGDFVRLVQRVFTTDALGCPVIYGVSNNAGAWWDNSKVSHLGWAPQDSADVFRDRFPAADIPPDINKPEQLFQGGAFPASGHFEDALLGSDQTRKDDK